MKVKFLISLTAILALGAMLALPASAANLKTASDKQAISDYWATTTPIKHIVVIFQENVSFDHYFGTYPNALNPSGEPSFWAAEGTPSVNGLTPALLMDNPNAANPMRLDRSQALTCDQDHGYTAEQKAFDHGLMDKFVQFTSGSKCTGTTPIDSPETVMGYYDGNTVTALWNYAQNFAMSDNSYGTTFGPFYPGRAEPGLGSDPRRNACQRPRNSRQRHRYLRS